MSTENIINTEVQIFPENTALVVIAGTNTCRLHQGRGWEWRGRKGQSLLQMLVLCRWGPVSTWGSRWGRPCAAGC